MVRRSLERFSWCWAPIRAMRAPLFCGKRGGSTQSPVYTYRRTALTLAFCCCVSSLGRAQLQGGPLTTQRKPDSDLQAADSFTIPIGTPLSMQTNEHLPMRLNQTIVGHLLYVTDVNDRVLLPAGTLVLGRVVALVPDRKHRLQARLRGDFTPFRIPVVRFDSIVLPNGKSLPLSATTATDGAPLLRLVPLPTPKGGFVRREFAQGIAMAKDRIAVITGPDKRDRLVQFLYTQLPDHPQRIQKDTAWTVETTASVTVPEKTPNAAPAGAAGLAGQGAKGPSTAGTTSSAWILNAYLKEPLSSSNASVGESVDAVVAEPVFTPDHALAVPQGAVLEGVVTQVRSARRFGRAGVLRFNFRQLQFPNGGPSERVQANLTGMDVAAGQNLTLDSEGQVKPKAQDKIAVPLILFALAARPLDRDRGDNAFGKDAVASNSLGVVGFIVGTAAGWRNVAAGIGYYGAALSIYERWIKRGAETTFARNTRIVVQATARQSAALPEHSR